jgi:hypothetical protein
MIIFQIFSVKRAIDQFRFWLNDFFGKMNFQSNGIRLNGDSVKWPFGKMAFRSTDFSVKRYSDKKIQWNDFSLKWSRTSHSCARHYKRKVWLMFWLIAYNIPNLTVREHEKVLEQKMWSGWGSIEVTIQRIYFLMDKWQLSVW